MEAYTGFAEVYDELMDDIPYDEWTEYVAELLSQYGVPNGLVAELGCGTGNVTVRLAKRGYDMIGIDSSQEMLSIAREKSASLLENQILYLLQDMREFELYGTVDAVVSICDSLNYILEEEELRQVFSLVNNYLERHGVFIFDLNTPYKYKKVLAQNTVAEVREDCSFIWENDFDEESGINEYDLTLFVQEKEDLFRRLEETHYQRAYELPVIKQLLKKAGMEFVAAYDAFTKEEPRPDSERIYVIAREGRQSGKLYL